MSHADSEAPAERFRHDLRVTDGLDAAAEYFSDLL